MSETILLFVGRQLLRLAHWFLGRAAAQRDRELEEKRHRQESEERRQDKARERRREIRRFLVQFNRLVKNTVRGWTADTRDEWIKRVQEVRESAAAVLDEMDVDRPTAGIEWCFQVERCLGVGQHWVTVYWGVYGEQKAARYGADRMFDLLLKLQEEYGLAYQAVIDEALAEETQANV